MSTDDISKYSELWTDIDNYALMPISDAQAVKRMAKEKYDICKKYPGGYIFVVIDPTCVIEVINKMLEAKVKILTQNDVDEANQPYHLWTDRIHEFVLISLERDPAQKLIYSRKFKQYLTFPQWSKEVTWDTVIQKMIENGVEIVDEAELDEMINNNPI